MLHFSPKALGSSDEIGRESILIVLLKFESRLVCYFLGKYFLVKTLVMKSSVFMQAPMWIQLLPLLRECASVVVSRISPARRRSRRLHHRDLMAAKAFAHQSRPLDSEA